jgi:RNA polymerase sigma-70 factor, ECF subfamily
VKEGIPIRHNLDVAAQVEIASSEPIGAETLFREHASFVAGFLVRLGVHHEDLDDLMQEVFIVAHRRGGFVPGPARPTTWLARIAIRVALAYRRTRRKQRTELNEEALTWAESAAPSPHTQVETSESLSIVQRALDSLEVERRALFVLFEIEGESCDDIAAGLGIPVGTVYSRLHAARREFQKAYDKLAVRAEKPAQPGVWR